MEHARSPIATNAAEDQGFIGIEQRTHEASAALENLFRLKIGAGRIVASHALLGTVLTDDMSPVGES